MPRTPIVLEALVGSYPTLPLAAGAADLTLTAADIVNLNSATFGSARALIVLALNTHATTPYNVTITSVADVRNRTGDITNYQVDAGDLAGFYLEREGWIEADKTLWFQGSNAAIKFCVIPVY